MFVELCRLWWYLIPTSAVSTRETSWSQWWFQPSLDVWANDRLLGFFLIFRFFFYKYPFIDLPFPKKKLLKEEKNRHQEKKEVACIVSKP